MIRCKLRCMERTERLAAGEANTWSVRLLPVIAKSKEYPGGSAENAEFFRWTPSGEVTMQFVSVPPVEVGGYYYLVMTETSGESDLWKLHTLGVSEDSLKVMLGLAWDTRPSLRAGEITLDINNPSAWAQFEGKAGTRWKVCLSAASADPGATFPSC